jgi:Holliday junction resolvase
MSGRRSRDKGNRTERAIVRLLQAQGIAATKISGMYKPGADISMPLLGSDRAVEVKCRAAGFRQLYDWLHRRDVLIVKERPSGAVGGRAAVAGRRDREGGCEMTQHIAAQRPSGAQRYVFRTRWPARLSGKAPRWASGG